MAMPRTILALMLREMSTTYGQSPGGYLWAFLDPIGAIALLTLAFGFLLRSPPLGTSFAMFYATGFLAFQGYQTVSNKTAQALRFSKALLAYPSVTFVDALLARILLTALTDITVGVVVIIGISLLYGLNLTVDFGAVALSIAMAVALGAGIGTLNCYIMTAFPAWERVWNIVNRPLFLISGVIFLVDQMSGQIQDMLWYNPIAHIIVELRIGLYSSYHPGFVSPAYVFLVSLTCMALGLMLLRKHYRALANEG